MKHYDKIFFAIAVIAAGASCAFYFMNAPKGELLRGRVESLEQKQPSGIAWKNIVVPALQVASIEWPEVRAQDEAGKWFFQVFTPPQIWVDKKGNFMTESPYYKEVARQSFALKYVGVSNEPYPIKYLGYFGTKKEPVIQFVDTVKNLSFIGKLNEEIVADAPSTGKKIKLGLTPKKFDIKRVRNNENNTIADIATVVLFDNSLKGATNLACGANEDDHHYTGLNIPRDVGEVEYNDLAKIVDGGICPQCGKHTLRSGKRRSRRQFNVAHECAFVFRRQE